MDGLHILVTAIFCFVVGIVFGVVVDPEITGNLVSNYIPPLATLFAAYYGASYAFKLQNTKEENQLKEKNIVAGNLVIFNLLRQLNVLMTYQQQIIDPVRNRRSAFLELAPTISIDQDNTTLNLDSLSFLFNSEDPNLLGHLSVEENKYLRTLSTINERSQIHLTQVQPLLDGAGVIQGADYTYQQIHDILGDRLTTILYQSKDQIIEQVDETIVSLRDISGKLSDIMKKQYPGEKIISILDAEESTGQ